MISKSWSDKAFKGSFNSKINITDQGVDTSTSFRWHWTYKKITKIKRPKCILLKEPKTKSVHNEYQDQASLQHKCFQLRIFFSICNKNHIFTAWVSLARIDIWVCRAYHSTSQLTAWVFVPGSTTFAIAHCPDLVFDNQLFFCIN